MIAEAVKHMLAANMSHEKIVEAVRDMEAARGGDPVAERRRAYDRERKAAAKAAKDAINSTGIPPETTGESGIPEPSTGLSRAPASRDNPNLLTLENIPPSPPTGALPPKPKREPVARTRSVGKPLPSDWEPKAAHFAKGEHVGRGPPWIHAEAARMREWAKANDHRAVSRKANWDSAFHNWLDSALEKNRNSNGYVQASRSGHIAVAELDDIAHGRVQSPFDQPFGRGEGEVAHRRIS